MIFYKKKWEKQKQYLYTFKCDCWRECELSALKCGILCKMIFISNFHNCQFIFFFLEFSHLFEVSFKSNSVWGNLTIVNRVQYASIVNLHSYAFERKSIVDLLVCAWTMMTLLKSDKQSVKKKGAKFFFSLNMEPIQYKMTSNQFTIL